MLLSIKKGVTHFKRRFAVVAKDIKNKNNADDLFLKLHIFNTI